MDIIEDGQIWMDMVEARNISSHTYDEKIMEMLLKLLFSASRDSIFSMKIPVEWRRLERGKFGQ